MNKELPIEKNIPPPGNPEDIPDDLIPTDTPPE